MGVEKFAKKEVAALMSMAGSSTRASVGPIEGMINLGAGDPDFNQPEFINKAVYDAMVAGHTHYSFTGEPDFKEAIAKYYKKYGVEIDPKTQVLITSGGSQAIFQAFAAILDPGDELIIFDPAYTGYNTPIAYFGAKMVRAKQVKNKDGVFRPDWANLEAVITDKTKAILFCTPDNPTGTVWTKDELKKLAEICVKHDIIAISDEIYTEFIWGGKKHETIIDLPGMWERTMVLMSFSKTFAWTGCRAGYIIAGPELMKVLAAVPVGICSVPVPFQKAAIVALEKGWDFVAEMKAEYERRIDYMTKRLNEIEGIKCPKPEGAFYLFPDISSFGIPSMKFAMEFFQQEKVRCAPGAAYGSMGEGHIRFALVKPIEELEEVCTRLERFVKNLPPQAPPAVP
ncbi:MAG: aminotransferase class I/II-fold pyridoxal phosphate-dependent enzyme [Candidatus Bathyarchaeota archaeon]|nr:aminotransferase class I/II-fold pyridoxal phosphate-dependent enzyme [Candidatus Bathyarchaeota archaeon]